MSPANRLALGAIVEPIATNRWTMGGPFCTVEMQLADSGGWDLGGQVKHEHYCSLHQAMMRAYNLAMGHAKQS
jgi:hypothetical protein